MAAKDQLRTPAVEDYSKAIFALESRIISVAKRTPLKQVYFDHLLELVKPLL